jgi:AcrR family transcriptional regulator
MGPGMIEVAVRDSLGNSAATKRTARRLPTSSRNPDLGRSMANKIASNTPPARPRAMRAADRALDRKRVAYEEEIRKFVEAGFSLVRETGELEPKVEAIVSKAGLSNQAFYRHFSSKDEFLLAMLDEGICLLRSYLEHRIESSDTPLVRIRNFIEGLIAQAVDPDSAAATRPFAISRARLAERFPEEVRESEAQLTAVLAHEIEKAQKSGEMRNASPERDARLVYNLAMSWVERELVTSGPSDEDDANHLVAFALHGLNR